MLVSQLLRSPLDLHGFGGRPQGAHADDKPLASLGALLEADTVGLSDMVTEWTAALTLSARDKRYSSPLGRGDPTQK
jgi:hypothetical protein